MPVLPEVASSRILSLVSAPARSPSRIIRAAGRSLTDPPGFFHSAFAYSSTLRSPASKPDNRMRGVFPIRSMTEAAVRGSPGVATDISDWSSPRLSQNQPQNPNRGIGLGIWGWVSQLKALFAQPALGVANLDRSEVQLLQLRLNRLAVADGDNRQAGGDEISLRHGQRLLARHGLDLFGVV